MAFATSTLGYGLANTGGALYPVRTTDSGRAWRVDGPWLWISAADAPATVESIGTASTSAAFAYGGGQVIDVTDDAGAQWYQATFSNVIAAGSSGSSLWVPTNASTITSLDTAPIWLYVSSDGGKTWSYRSTLPGLAGAAASLLVTSPSTGFAIVGKDANYVQSSGIVETTDGGKHWATRSDPCNVNAAPRIFASQQLGGTSPTNLWLACGSVPGGTKTADNAQVKDVFRSSDSGEKWTSVASTVEIAYPEASANLSLEGSLADTGATSEVDFGTTRSFLLLLAGATACVRAPNGVWVGRNILEVSTDGGSTWRGAPTAVATQYPQRVASAGADTIVQTVTGLWEETASGIWRRIA